MATKSKSSQKSKLPIFPIAVVVILIALVGFAWFYGKKESPKKIEIPTTPVMVSSVEQSLEPYRGKVVILDIWATWCPPCIREIPDFIKLQNQYRSQGLEIIGVSVDPVDSRGGGGAAAVAPFMKNNGINYTIWMINNSAALGAYPIGQGYPTTYVIDRNGRVVQKYVGAQPMSRFETDIKALL
jgi:cytochrome c biogenesis protein CcmG/thiol:disulfide interchange protein DsbE